MRSIRRDLTVLLLAVTLLLESLGGVALFAMLRAALLARFDEALAAKVRALATLVQFENGGVEFEFADENMPEFERDVEPEYFQVWLPGGRTLERSRSLRGGDLKERAGDIARPVAWSLELPDGRPGRAAGIRFLPQPGESAEAFGQDWHDVAGDRAPEDLPVITLVVARDRGPLIQELRAIASALISIALLGAGLAVVVVPLVVRRGLAPLSHAARRAARIDASSLGTRFETDGLPSELVPITQLWNELLARLEAAFARERRFTADVAHELRTPIAELRSMAEVAARKPRSADESRRTFEEVVEVSRQMERMVASLLELRRSESDGPAPAGETLDVAGVVREVVAAHRGAAQGRGLVMDVRLPAEAFARADRTMLSSIVSNLVGNAVAYAPAGSSVAVRLEASEDGFLLSVANPDETLEAEDLEQLFAPFWRKDPARTGSVHCGLGLTVAQAFAKRLGCTLRARKDASGEFRVELWLPAASSASSASPDAHRGE